MENNSKRKCKCDASKNGWCKNCSKIKMFVGLKNGFKNQGLTVYIYSFYRQNNRPETYIIDDMLKRFKMLPQYANAVNKLMFFDNKTNTKIREYSIC